MVARIGDRRILTAKEYGDALNKRWKGVRNLEAATAAAPIILQKLIEQRLLLAEAEDRGYPERLQFRHAVHSFETSLKHARLRLDAVRVMVAI